VTRVALSGFPAGASVAVHAPRVTHPSIRSERYPPSIHTLGARSSSLSSLSLAVELSRRPVSSGAL